jgi:hypothetical protein
MRIGLDGQACANAVPVKAIAYEQPVEIVTSISLEPEQELAILEGNAKRLLKINNK